MNKIILASGILSIILVFVIIFSAITFEVQKENNKAQVTNLENEIIILNDSLKDEKLRYTSLSAQYYASDDDFLKQENQIIHKELMDLQNTITVLENNNKAQVTNLENEIIILNDSLKDEKSRYESLSIQYFENSDDFLKQKNKILHKEIMDLQNTITALENNKE